MGELALGLTYRGVRRAGWGLLLRPRPRRGDRARELGAASPGVAVQTDTATRRASCSGPRSRSSDYLVPAIKGEKIPCLASLSLTPALTSSGSGRAVARTAMTSDQRLEDVHITNGHRADLIASTKTDRGRLRRLHALPRAHGPARRRPRRSSRSSARTHPTRRCWPSTTCAFPPPLSWARSAGASTTSCGSPRGERLIGAAGMVSVRPDVLRHDAAVRARAQGVRP